MATFVGVSAFTSREKRLTLVSVAKVDGQDRLRVAAQSGRREETGRALDITLKAVSERQPFEKLHVGLALDDGGDASSCTMRVSTTTGEKPYTLKICAAMALSFSLGQAHSFSSRSISTLPSMPQISSRAVRGIAVEVRFDVRDVAGHQLLGRGIEPSGDASAASTPEALVVQIRPGYQSAAAESPDEV